MGAQILGATWPEQLNFAWWGVFSARLVSCHPSGSYNFEMATTFLENMWTPAMKKPLWSSRVTHTICKWWQIIQYNREAGR